MKIIDRLKHHHKRGMDTRVSPAEAVILLKRLEAAETSQPPQKTEVKCPGCGKWAEPFPNYLCPTCIPGEVKYLTRRGYQEERQEFAECCEVVEDEPEPIPQHMRDGGVARAAGVDLSRLTPGAITEFIEQGAGR